MKKIIFKEKYPIFTLTLNNEETKYSCIDDIFEFFKNKITAHPIATFIAEFDHYKHTKSLPEHIIEDGIIDAKNLIFCFGKELPTSKMLAVRPRSIGIAQYEDRFEISILEVPNEMLHKVLEGWIKELAN